MKNPITYNLTEREARAIEAFLKVWRDEKYGGGELTIKFHNQEPQRIHYRQIRFFDKDYIRSNDKLQTS